MKIQILVCGLLLSTASYADIALKCDKVFGKGPYESFDLKLPHLVGEEVEGDVAELVLDEVVLSSIVTTEYGWSFNLNFQHDEVTTSRMHVGWDDDGVSAYLEYLNNNVAYNSFYRCVEKVDQTEPLVSTTTLIKAAFDHFTYTMEVEGAALSNDLTIQAFEELQRRLVELTNDGVSYASLVHAAVDYVRAPSVRAEIKQALRLIDMAHLSQDDMQTIIHNILRLSYRTGVN